MQAGLQEPSGKESEPRKRGRPRKQVTRERAMEAIELLKRSEMSDREIAAFFTGDPFEESLPGRPARNGGTAPEQNPGILQVPSPEGRTIEVVLAPLHDGVSPLDPMLYLPDLLLRIARELAGIKEEMHGLNRAVDEILQAKRHQRPEDSRLTGQTDGTTTARHTQGPPVR